MESESPPRQMCCFCYSTPKKDRGKQRSAGENWDKRDEMLSDISTFSEKEQKRRLKAALKEEERINREAEKVVKLDDKLDKIRSDVFQLQPFPTVEQAYAYVRREDIRQSVMLSQSDNVTAAAMISKGTKTIPQLQMTFQPMKQGSFTTGGGKPNAPTKAKGQVENGGGSYSHCGNSKHTRETCFKLHGYPNWWHEFKARKQKESKESNGGTARVAMACAEPQLSLAPLVENLLQSTTDVRDSGTKSGSALLVPNEQKQHGWIVDSGATNHMTFCSNDFTKRTRARRTSISNTNGVMYPVTGAGIVDL
ncbi:hypothetical protein RJ641_000753 [Dillenia turbinata]|uniref:Retrovirus-related Pol polyprotein from transposon TNT 1-94-like beta-barrel domain-containing protein n=1 Tax=Dillenia turbinata TaxID=194707 RepID=A0AAN8ZW20_9MAGN